MNYSNKYYGLDFLSLLLLILGGILNYFRPTRLLSLLIVIYALYRAFSTNTYKRNNELQAFYNVMDKILIKFNKSMPRNISIFHFEDLQPVFGKLKYSINQKLHYKIVSCPKCGQKLRLPRKKGNITVTCKRCSSEFKMRT